MVAKGEKDEIRRCTRSISWPGFDFTLQEWSYLYITAVKYSSEPLLVSLAVLSPKGGQDWCCFWDQRQQNFRASPSSLRGCQQFELFAEGSDCPCILKLCLDFEAAEGRWSWPGDRDCLWMEGLGWKAEGRALVSWVYCPGCHWEDERESFLPWVAVSPHISPGTSQAVQGSVSPEGWLFASAALGSCLGSLR